MIKIYSPTSPACESTLLYPVPFPCHQCKVELNLPPINGWTLCLLNNYFWHLNNNRLGFIGFCLQFSLSCNLKYFDVIAREVPHEVIHTLRRKFHQWKNLPRKKTQIPSRTGYQMVDLGKSGLRCARTVLLSLFLELLFIDWYRHAEAISLLCEYGLLRTFIAVC